MNAQNFQKPVKQIARTNQMHVLVVYRTKEDADGSLYKEIVMRTGISKFDILSALGSVRNILTESGIMFLSNDQVDPSLNIEILGPSDSIDFMDDEEFLEEREAKKA